MLDFGNSKSNILQGEISNARIIAKMVLNVGFICAVSILAI